MVSKVPKQGINGNESRTRSCQVWWWFKGSARLCYYLIRWIRWQVTSQTAFCYGRQANRVRCSELIEGVRSYQKTNWPIKSYATFAKGFRNAQARAATIGNWKQLKAMKSNEKQLKATQSNATQRKTTQSNAKQRKATTMINSHTDIIPISIGPMRHSAILCILDAKPLSQGQKPLATYSPYRTSESRDLHTCILIQNGGILEVLPCYAICVNTSPVSMSRLCCWDVHAVWRRNHRKIQ